MKIKVKYVFVLLFLSSPFLSLAGGIKGPWFSHEQIAIFIGLVVVFFTSPFICYLTLRSRNILLNVFGWIVLSYSVLVTMGSIYIAAIISYWPLLISIVVIGLNLFAVTYAMKHKETKDENLEDL